MQTIQYEEEKKKKNKFRNQSHRDTDALGRNPPERNKRQKSAKNDKNTLACVWFVYTNSSEASKWCCTRG